VALAAAASRLDSQPSTSITPPPSDEKIAMAFDHFFATWMPLKPRPHDEEEENSLISPTSKAADVLKNLNFSIAKGELVLVVGPVGCSKSSLLLAMLGELAPNPTSDLKPNRVAPFSKVGSMSYCSQEPWIMSTTVKANILFGKDYDADQYHQALVVCDLISDLALLPAGEDTVIGDKGKGSHSK
jgi:ABC-type transport system involved in cytochrome bd biosynthesis fused ATPase/permease subunit